MIFDCPDPAGLAAFYSALLGLPVTYQEDDFAVVSVNDTTSGIAFQRVADYHPPRWPDPAQPQQLHFDVMVDDVAAAGPRCWRWAPGRSAATLGHRCTPTRPGTRSA